MPEDSINKNITENGLEGTKGSFPGFVLAAIQILCAFASVFGNVLITRVIYNLRDSRLRKTTKLLISFVSVSHCIFSFVLTGRLFGMPCILVLLCAFILGIDVLWGLLFLAIESFILVKKPTNHHRFTSVKVCVVEILFSCLVTLGLNLALYLTQKDPDDASFCYTTNGICNPWLLIFLMCIIIGMIMCATVVKLCTLRALRKTSPIQTDPVPSVSFNLSPMPNPSVHPPSAAPAGSARMSPLHRLTVILSVSLLCFIICWLPICICYIIFSLFEILEIEVSIESKVLSGVSSLAMLNGSLHVAVYVVMSTQIRQALKKYVKSWWCLG